MKLLAISPLFSARAVAGCKREQRVFDPGSSGAQIANGVALNEVHAGGPLPSRSSANTKAVPMPLGRQASLQAYNCVGCHDHGGGGIGPALMDAEWIYGSHPEQIYSTIVQGRPNGMPSFAGKIPDYQVWELVAYVRSMSGQLPADVAPSRSDEMPVRESGASQKKEHPCRREPAEDRERAAMILAVPGFSGNQTT